MIRFRKTIRNVILTFERIDTLTFSVDGYAVSDEWRLMIFPN